MTGHGRFRASMLAVVVSLCVGGCASTGGSRLLSRAGDAMSLGRAQASNSQLKNPVKLHLSYARLQEQLGNVSEARHSYESALGERPKSVEAILGLARLDQLAGRSYEAEQGFRRALDLASDDPKVLDSVGQFFASRKNWDRAIELLQRAVTAQPDSSTIRQHLAIALARSGDADTALAHFERTVGDAPAHYNIALILYEQGHLEEAEQHLLQAVIKQPDLQEAQVWLDEIRRERGSQELLASHDQNRFEELPPPQPDPERPAFRKVPWVADSPPSTPTGHVPQATSRFGDTVESDSRAAAPFPTLEAHPTLPTTPNLAPDPSSMTPEQLEQWQNSVTPSQFEQWRNQMSR